MTNVYASERKVQTRRRLFDIGIEALKNEGWSIERVPGAGKSSLRRIRKGGETMLVSIRTTQDTWIAFPRDKRDEEWTTLSDADFVLAVSVDDRERPRYGQAHLVEGDEMRSRFDRAYRARQAAGHKIPVGRGVWLSLYQEEAEDPANRVGAGVGLSHPAIYRVPLEGSETERPEEEAEDVRMEGAEGLGEELTIGEAKRRLALTLGVDPSSVKITIEA